MERREKDVRDQYGPIMSRWMSDEWRQELEQWYAATIERERALVMRAVSVPMTGDRSYRAWVASGAGKTYGEYIDDNHIDLLPELIDDNGSLLCTHIYDDTLDARAPYCRHWYTLG